MRHLPYHYDMKLKILVLAILSLGCTQKAPEPTVKQMPPMVIKGHKCNEKTTVVAIIDTGFNYPTVSEGVKLCKYGHRNFTELPDSRKIEGLKAEVPVDNHGHGTNIAGLIQKYAGNANFCMVILKYYDPKVIDSNNMKNTIKAIQYATAIGANYINYSGGGTDFSPEERNAVKKFLDKGGKFVAAAGNERSDLKKRGYYPAMDDTRVIRVGSRKPSGEIESYSNYGEPITRWEYGTDAVGFGVTMSGTSQAAAIATGKIINESECDK